MGGQVSDGASLLLVACSQRKRDTPGLLPAIERYDGPIFRLIRRFRRHHPIGPTVAILSAAFGLILADQPIPWYDRRMTRARAHALRPEVEHDLRATVRDCHPREVFICMGKAYREALPDCAAILPADLPVHVAAGTMGAQLAALHDWLYGEPPPPAHGSTANGGRAINIRGVAIALSAEQALHVARYALATGSGDPDAFQAWYVTVDDRRVAPKWLVSRLSGLPVSAFTTDEARRVLARLGIEVRRV